MTNSKNTKRALLTSALSVVLCIAMLVGATFAWFTDSVTSSGNIIKSGTLDVTMEWRNGTEDPAAAEGWTDASHGAIFSSTLWEPGYTEARHVKISNVGSLALKYEVRIIPTGEVGKLADVIDVYYIKNGQQLTDRNDLTDANKIGTLAEVLARPSAANGHISGKAGDVVSSDIATIALKMREDAGNEYQGLAIGSDFAIQLVATQYTEETDSFDDQYDKDAVYPVTNAGELRDALTAEKAKIILANDVQILDEGLTVTEGQTIEIDLNRNTLEVPAGSEKRICTFTNNGGNLILKNGTIKNNDTIGGTYNADSPDRNAAIESYGGTLTVENCTVSNAAPNTGNYAVKIKDCAATFKNCEISSTRGAVNIAGTATLTFDDGVLSAGIHYPLYQDGNAIAEFNNTHLVKENAGSGNYMMYSAAYSYETGEVTFHACTFESKANSSTPFLTWWKNEDSKQIPIHFNNCTWKNVTDNTGTNGN